jgi:hypothetical protein
MESLSPIMSVQVRLRRDRFKEIGKTESDITPVKNHSSRHSLPKKFSVGLHDFSSGFFVCAICGKVALEASLENYRVVLKFVANEKLNDIRSFVKKS